MTEPRSPSAARRERCSIGRNRGSATFATTRGAEPRRAPQFERRAVEIHLVPPPFDRRTSMRAYLFGVFTLAAISVGGWFALGEYIYG